VLVGSIGGKSSAASSAPSLGVLDASRGGGDSGGKGSGSGIVGEVTNGVLGGKSRGGSVGGKGNGSASSGGKSGSVGGKASGSASSGEKSTVSGGDGEKISGGGTGVLDVEKKKNSIGTAVLKVEKRKLGADGMVGGKRTEKEGMEQGKGGEGKVGVDGSGVGEGGGGKELWEEEQETGGPVKKKKMTKEEKMNVKWLEKNAARTAAEVLCT